MSWETVGNWTVSLVVGGLAGISTQLLSWRHEGNREKAVQTRVATYLALRIAVILEAFAIDCDDLLNENQRAQRPDDSDEGPRTTLPNLGPYPDTVDWRLLDVALANRALAFRNDLALSANRLAFNWDVYQKPQSEAADDEAAMKGVQAWDLASAIRRAHALPGYHPGFDVRANLQKQIDRVAAEDEQARKINFASLDHLIPGSTQESREQ